jgi:hypothetical protein
VTDASNASAVAAFLAGMNIREPVLVASPEQLPAVASSVEGALTVHVVNSDGRVLATQVRVPGARPELIVEDLAALASLLKPT